MVAQGPLGASTATAGGGAGIWGEGGGGADGLSQSAFATACGADGGHEIPHAAGGVIARACSSSTVMASWVHHRPALPLPMFVRFRQHGSRLYVSLVRARRVDGKPRQEQVAALGGVPVGADPGRRPYVATRERVALWQCLHQSIADLPAEEQGRLMAAVHARVPLPTEEERGAADLSEAEHDAAFWERMRATSLKQADGYRQLAALAERKAAEGLELAKQEAERAAEARAKAARLANYKGA
jgi:hypothetical protein